MFGEGYFHKLRGNKYVGDGAPIDDSGYYYEGPPWVSEFFMKTFYGKVNKPQRFQGMDFMNEQNESKILDYIEPYLDSKSVKVKHIGDYLIVDVQSPSYFEEFGFGKGEGLAIKDKLRKNGFMSIGVGEYAKKIN